ncbi:hypothetical protein F5880DRAFT_1582519 [Lentinula raphanica]|nr:hypothetical protein F5880DRAFT_1582519 [Lentinula raphanica]
MRQVNLPPSSPSESVLDKADHINALMLCPYLLNQIQLNNATSISPPSITMSSFNSTNRTYFAYIWCMVYVNMGFLASLLSTMLIMIHPAAAPSMPERQHALSRRSCSTRSQSSLISNMSVESISSTTTEETNTPDTPKEEVPMSNRPKDTRRRSISFLNTNVVLTYSKSITRPIKPFTRRLSSSSHVVAHGFKESIVIPTSKLTHQILPASKASSQKTVNKVVSFTRQSVKATKKLVTHKKHTINSNDSIHE